MIIGRVPAPTAPLVAAVALLLAGCTDDAPSGAAPTSSTASSSASSAAAAGPTGPLTATVAAAPVGTTAVYRLGVSGSGEPALVFDAPGTLPPDGTRVGTGADPAGAASPVTGVSSGNGIGSVVVGDDGSVTALAVLDTGDALGLHVLRIAPDGTQSVARVADAGISRLYADTVDAVSDDGTTAVVATIDRLASYPDGPDHLRVLTVDLATATTTAQVEVPMGTEGGLPDGTEPAAVRIGPDGAVTVLVGTNGGQLANSDGAWLARFTPGLVPAGTVALDPAAENELSRMDLTADGTAVVAMRVDTRGRLATRLVTVAPGSDEVVPLAELESVLVGAVVTGPEGWAHLVATDPSTDVGDPVRPLDLTTGELGAAVPVCPGGTDDTERRSSTFGLARSGSGDALLAVSSCGRFDVRVAVLERP